MSRNTRSSTRPMSLQRGLLGSYAAFALFAGCVMEAGDDAPLDDAPSEPDRGGDVAPVVDSPRDPASRPAAATTPNTAPHRHRTVFVQLAAKAQLQSARAVRDWKQRGRAVHAALEQTAASSQASLRAYLERRKIAYKSYWAVNVIRVTADAGTIREIEARSDVARIVEDRTFALPPHDPGVQAAAVRAVEWNIANIRAPEAWSDFGTQGEGIVVATIDTGAQFDHPALAMHYRGLGADGTLDHNYSWHDPSGVCGDPEDGPCDNDGHGTHTTGTIVGDDGGDNQIGVAPAARWISAKGCESSSCSFDALLSSGEWMLAPTDLAGENPRPDLRPHIVSNSWGGGSGDDFYREIVEAWVAAGIFPVFANGNSGPSCGSANSPGDYPESYAVGAYDIDEIVADFSSRGPSAFGDIKPNIAAPGVDVRSSVPGGYAVFSGTSMATPHVAGAVALLWSAAPALAGDVAATRALFDGTAVDHEGDDECGGEEGNDNAWGEGQLDVYATLTMAPIGPTGYLSGQVVDDDGDPIPSARVSVSGEHDRQTTTDADGQYSLRLPLGTYDTEAAAFGYLSEAGPDVDITEEVTTTLDFELEAAPMFVLDGFVRDGAGGPIVGATVSVLGTPIAPVITDETGAYSFAAVPQGEYLVRADAGGCLDTEEHVVELTVDTSRDFALDYRSDAFGYQCRPVAFAYEPGTTRLPLDGLDVQTSITLPFPVLLYGESTDRVVVASHGYVAFESAYPNYINESLPARGTPNGAVYGLWDDLYIEPDAGVYTATYGSAPERRFVIEWRDISFTEALEQRTTFTITLHENGDIVTQYLDTASGSRAEGSSATIGIEDGAGATALQYSYNRRSVASGTATLYEVPFSGFVSGSVIDGNDELPIGGVTVTATNADGDVRTAKTTSAGEYRLQLTAGVYRVSLAKLHYESVETTLTVVEDETVEFDGRLDTALAVIDPTSIAMVLGPNEVRTRVVTAGNAGLVDMSFAVHEAGGSRQQIVATRHFRRAPGADPHALTTRGLYPDRPPGSGITPSSPGDIISSFAPDEVESAWGIGESEHLWLSDIDVLANVEYTDAGEATGRAHGAGWAGDFPGDMAYDGSRDLMCQVAVGNDNGIHCWDPSTGEIEESIEGAFEWTMISQRGLAYRADDDSFYVGGWNEGVIYHVAGLSHDEPGEVLGACSPSDGDISGLAYNAAENVLWVATNSDSDTLYQVSADDCTTLSTLPPPQSGGYQGAGLEMDEEGNLWVVAQSPSRVYLVESGVPAFGDIAWLTVDPTEGEVEPGESATLEVTIDTTDLEPGLYLGSLFVTSNSGRRPTTRIPVSLVVSGYVRAANAGGSEYLDVAGDTWPADQAYVAGEWGYVQKGKVRNANSDISGTDDDPLYQSQRENMYAYRYDDVPDGIYEIDLRFAELQRSDFGDRLFDVIVEQELLLPAHDIYYEVGRRAADDHTFFVHVTDGRLDVRLVPRAGTRKPVINAVRVRHRPDR